MNRHLSPKVREVISYSREEAERLQNNYIGPEHIFLGILRDGEGKAVDALKQLGINTLQLKRLIESQIRKPMTAVNEDIAITKYANKIIKMSMLESRLQKSENVDTEHVVLALLKDEMNLVADLLSKEGINYDTFYNMLYDYHPYEKDSSDLQMGGGFIEDDEDDEDSVEKSGPSGNASKTGKPQKPSNDTPVLNNFGFDMTRAAADGKLDPVVGREKEIERLAQILSRRKKNNPVLIGEPGVGKSAIVEGLALRIVQKRVSRALFDRRVVTLDMASIVAGTKYRGQFEERIKAILNELTKNPNIILFIDEIHTIIGAGGASGSLDAANILKPALSRGEIQCIGATTLDEFRKSIERDGALERRFQKILVNPTTAEETLQILENIKNGYENHHNVQYSQAALAACVKLTERYISDRYFPDKAIDALDESGARVHITNIVVPKHIEDLERIITETEAMKTVAVKAQNFEAAANLRDKIRDFNLALNTAQQCWEEEIKQNRPLVDESQVEEVIAMMSGIPVQRVAQAEMQRLSTMKGELTSKVIGQDDAVDKVIRSIRRNRAGLKDPSKPIGTFMFLGPTGVGKTHLAKKLAEFLFDSSEALIRIDMSEYMEKFTVSRLIGAPPGYVGYEEGGQLTERVRRKPYSVVLLDEIEKAHPDVFNLLLQVLDEGTLTDSLGRKIDFRNTVIIMTSNTGTRQLKDFGRGVGFQTQNRANDREFARGVIQKALQRSFSPEFLNRVDEVIIFDQLDKTSIFNIIDLELIDFSKRLAHLGYTMELSDEAREFLAEKGYDVQFGARPLKRAIQQYLEDGMAEMIINAAITTGDTIIIDLDKDTKKIVMNKKQQKEAENVSASI
ncbi:MAG: ATP-dependent Clp protease ATP-binding subunit [Bacteroidales bacterium]|jgi:ATP-dependent Clp protease ATP-binding subunit ClpC|nr:ATP-dependent Clp protease ATP-binding subunit [Bacteroidales bacterium]